MTAAAGWRRCLGLLALVVTTVAGPLSAVPAPAGVPGTVQLSFNASVLPGEQLLLAAAPFAFTELVAQGALDAGE
jgi:hypothetical protein